MELHSVREILLAGSKNGRRVSRHREHTTALAQTNRRYGAEKKLTRHSYARHAERVTSSPDHSAWLDRYCNDERKHENVWSCCEILKKLGVRTAVLTGPRGNCRSPPAISNGKRAASIQKDFCM
jgi:hypothetical protein